MEAGIVIHAGSTKDTVPRTAGNRWQQMAQHRIIASTYSKWRGVGDMQASTPPHTKHIASTT